MKNMYQELKKHGREILTGALVVGAGLIFNGCGEEIYRGNLGDKEVVYEEGRFAAEGMNLQNKMTFTKGDTTYFFRDYLDETDIDWKSQNKPDFENDKLEIIAIKTPTGTKKYSEGIINHETLDGEHAKIIFDKSNQMYNDFRKQIRKDLRSQHRTKLKSLENALN